jgi:predicted MFS family arabinose efflux permease
LTTTSVRAETETDIASTQNGTRVILALCVASLFAVLNFVAPTPFFPGMSDDLDSTVSRLGLGVTLIPLISAVVGIAIGPLSDRFGYRWPLVIGLLAIGINLIGTGITPIFLPLLGLWFIGGIADALAFGMPMAIIGANFSGEAQQKAISWTWGSMSSAGIVGVPLIGLIGGFAGWRTAVTVAGAGAIAAAWFAAVSVPPDPKRESSPFHIRELLDSYLPLVGQSSIFRLFGVTFFRAAAWIGLLTYLGSFLQDELGLSVKSAGFVYTLGGGGFALGSLVAGKKFDRLSPRAIVAISTLVAALSIGGMLITSSLWTTLPLLFITGFACAISGVAIATILATESPAGAGTTMVLNTSMLNFGTAAGASTGGLLLSLGGYRAVGIGFAIFSLIAAALATWSSQTHSHRTNS